MENSKNDNSQCWKRCEITEILTLLRGMKNGVAISSGNLAVTNKTKHTLYDLAIGFMGIYSKELKAYAHTKSEHDV